MSSSNLIFHERQEGSLCAQHCLNALLQDAYYGAVDLASIAAQLDDAEQVVSPNAGSSANMDDTGFFSIQVLTKALAVFDLELLPLQSPEVRHVQQNPVLAQAFVCNLQEHWFAIRRLGNKFYNLNSLLDRPEAISDTYLSLFLAQLQNEGHAIYVVQGQLPPCRADDMVEDIDEDEDEELQRALVLSASDRGGQSAGELVDEDLERAIQMSLDEKGQGNSSNLASKSTTSATTSSSSAKTSAAASASTPFATSAPATTSASGASALGSEGGQVLGGAADSAASLRDRRQAFLDRLQKQQNDPKQSK